MIVKFLRHLLSLIEKDTNTMTDTPVTTPRPIDVVSADLIGARATHTNAKQTLTNAQQEETAAANHVQTLVAEAKAALASIEAEAGGIVSTVEDKIAEGVKAVEAAV